MREIKFRVWYSKYNKMVPIDGQDTVACLNDDELISMQYTGLKDKNGKEIYEDDSIKTPAGIGIVKFENGCYWILWYGSGRTTLHDCQVEDLEIIGNIYENPLQTSEE